MRKKVRRSVPQSSFLDVVDKVEYGEDTIPDPAKLEVVEEFITFPKVVFASLYCPDCSSKAKLRPDGVAECPNCVVRIPCKTARLKGEKSEGD